MAKSLVQSWITQYSSLHAEDSKSSMNTFQNMEHEESRRGQKRSSSFPESPQEIPEEEAIRRYTHKKQVQEDNNGKAEVEGNVYSADNSDVTAEFSVGQAVQVGELSITSGSIFSAFQLMDESTDGCDLKLRIQCPSEANIKTNHKANSHSQLTHAVSSEDFRNPGASLSLSSQYFRDNETGTRNTVSATSNIFTKTNVCSIADEDDWLQLRLNSTSSLEKTNGNSTSLQTLQLLEPRELNRSDSSNPNSFAMKHNGGPFAQDILMQRTPSQPSKLNTLLASQQYVVDQRSNISLISALTSTSGFNQAGNSIICDLIKGSHNHSKPSTLYPNLEVLNPSVGFQNQVINPAIMHPSVLNPNMIAMNNKTQSSRSPANLMALDLDKLLPSRTGSMTSWISEAIAAGAGKALLTRNITSPVVTSPGFEPQTFKSISLKDVKATPSSSTLNLVRKSQPATGLWFALQPESATSHESTDSTLYQSISSESNQQSLQRSYIRIKHGDMPVTAVKKYLATKLALSDETKVELKCRGKYLEEHISLNDVWDHIWLPFSLKNEFVMVISYRISYD